ncbi:LysR family transcriptional regulator [Salmonella enterica]|nr:LysR family transcriptional regulator [Salmonella enterica]ELJ4842946.1 LysR family transcriptional regulator [Salmonella enterica]
MNSLDWYIRSQLKLRHLQLLVALDDLRNVGKVANYLHVSQPAVSKSLSELENNIGLKLFQRTAYGMQPTIYGSSLVMFSRKILAELGKARDELRALVSGLEGKVSVGVLPGAAVVVLPEAISQLKHESPVTGIAITEGNMGSLKPKLLSGEIEIIIGILPEDNHHADMEHISLYQDKLVLVAGNKHPLATKKNIGWHDLYHTSWILPPNDSMTRQPIENEFRRHQLTLPTNYIESISTMVNVGILCQGNAIAFLPSAVAGYYVKQGMLAILPTSVPKLRQSVGILHMKSQALSPSARLFIATLKNIYGCSKDI